MSQLRPDDALTGQETQDLRPKRPTFNTTHSSDQSRFMTLERLQQNMNLSSRHGSKKHRDLALSDPAAMQQLPQDRQLTIETAVFPEQQTLFHADITRRSHTGYQSDTKSIRSGSESNTRSSTNATSMSTTAPNSTSTTTPAPAPTKRTKKNRRRRGANAKPAEIFAQNLSEAVLDANDSDEHESFVYRPSQSLLYPALPSSPWSMSSGILSYAKRKTNLQQESLYGHGHTPRRPVLRSAISEMPATSYWRLSGQQRGTYHRNPRPHDWYPSDADEEQGPLLRRTTRKHRTSTSGKMICMWLFVALSVMGSMSWLGLILLATPLRSVDVLEISNVLGSSKELFFDLHVRAKNSNWWSIKVSHASFSVFASSHYVPTVQADVNTSAPFPEAVAQQAPVEFLGTVYLLDEPLLFDAGHWLKPVVSTAVSQIQIKEPGATHGDDSGNERWSLLIRYPYELTVRGVLKYPVDPFNLLNQVHSARVCLVSRIDPSTGDVTDAPQSEKAICDDPGPGYEPSGA